MTPASDGRPATSADVAERAGVSRTTVSYILNGKPGVSFSDETREAVLRAASELAYLPNAAARSLVARSGPVVFVLSSLPHNEMTATGMSVLSRAFAERGIMTTVLQVSTDLDETVEAIIAMQARAVLPALPLGSAAVERLTAAGIQVVEAGADLGHLSVGAIQVEHLLSAGHRRIAFADVVESDRFGVLPRRAAVAAACAEQGLAAPEAAEISRDGVGAAEVVAQWHAAGVTAVCAYNDEVALAVLYGIREAGLRCPLDIAVIGCDDLPSAAVAYPPLTSVSFNLGADVDVITDVVLNRLGLIDTPPAAPRPMLSVASRASV